MSAPFAIAVAPNGARRTKADHPRLPMTPAETAREAAAAREAGAAMLHLHIRDRAGVHLLEAELYRAALAAARAEAGPDMLLQITTEAVGRYAPAEQIALVDALRPASVSLALREVFADEAGAAALFRRMEGWGTLYQIILYDTADLARMEALQARGLLPGGPLPVLPVMGRYSGTGAEAAELEAYLAAGITRHAFMLCAFGAREAEFMAEGARHGGHARVGFENNLWLPDGSVAPDNAALVAAVAQAVDRPLADADTLRAIWFTPAETTMKTPESIRRDAIQQGETT